MVNDTPVLVSCATAQQHGRRASGASSSSSSAAVAAAAAAATASQSTIFGLWALVYLTYNMSSAVLAQFLTLYYKSKGFDGTVLGVLSCLTPVTTLVMAPMWGIVLGRPGTDSRRSQFGILCLSVTFSVLIRTSLALLETPGQFLVVAAWQGVFHAPIRPMMDALVLDQMFDRTVFGKVRLFGILGTGVGTSLGGHLLTLKWDEVEAFLVRVDGYLRIHDSVALSGMWHGRTGFDLIFLAHILLTIPTLFFMRQLRLLNQTTTTATRPEVKARDCCRGERGTIEGSTAASTKSAAGRMQDVARYVVRKTAHMEFFAIAYILGISGGVGDAFTCEFSFEEFSFVSVDQIGPPRRDSSNAF
jgi:MFS_1 like family